MDFLENLRLGQEGLRASKVRSTLTALGIIIGVAAVIIMIAIGQGARVFTFQVLEETLGSNLLLVIPGSPTKSATVGRPTKLNPLTYEDALALKKRCFAVTQVVPEVGITVGIRYGNRDIRTYLNGVTSEFPEVRNFHVARGRFISDLDVDLARNVCCLGKTVAKNLFPGMDPIGQRIMVRGLNRSVGFRVIGTMEEKGEILGLNQDDIILVPVTTAQQRLLSTNNVSRIYLKVSDSKAMAAATEQVESVLYKRHNNIIDFTITSQEEILGALNTISTTFTSLLAGIASISLIVGGIGIMNIMLVVVTERTREIGLRKAVGARRRDILFQFLIESSMISTLGGAVGIIFGVGGAKFFSVIGNWPFIISGGSIVMAFGIAFSIGVFFGFYPSQRASKLDPIEALRHE